MAKIRKRVSNPTLKPSQVDPKDQRPSFLLYGDPGSGKTTLASTAQDVKEMKDVLFLSVEGGLLAVAARRDIDFIEIADTDHLEEIYWAIANEDDNFKKYGTIVIDSITELQTVNLENIVEKDKRPIEKRDEITLRNYGVSTAQLRRLLRWFRDLPYYIMYTALSKEIFPSGAGENTPPEAVTPSLTAKLGQSVLGYVDYVWYTYVTEEEDEDGEDLLVYNLLTQPAGIYKAKTRGMNFPKELGQVVQDPSMVKIMDVYNKSEVKKGKK